MRFFSKYQQKGARVISHFTLITLDKILICGFYFNTTHVSISFLHCRKLTALYWLSFSLRTKSSMRWQRSSTALMAGRTPTGAQPWSTSWGRVRTRCWGSYKRSSMRPSGIRRLIVTSGSSSLMTSFRKTWPDSYGLGQR